MIATVYMIRKTVVYLSLVAVMLMSGACGFHLRGTDSTALVPRRWTVTGADSLLKNALENALRQAGARLDPEQADYGLRILELEEHSQADKLSGYRDELELRARLRWQWETAAGEALVPPEELERQRYVSVSRRYNAALVEQENRPQGPAGRAWRRR